MKESVAVAKEADAKKGVSSTRSDNSIHRLRDEPERQLGSLRDVIGNIMRDGGKPSVESIATELSGVHTAQRAPVLLALQQTHGNRYVQRVVAGIQAKLVVGQPGDKYEQEADRVADVVMRMPEPGVQRQVEPEEEETLQTKPLAEQITPFVQVQRQEEPEEEEEEEEMLQAKPLAEQITPLVQRQVVLEKEEEDEELIQAKIARDVTSEVTPVISSGIQSLQGGGRPLSGPERSFFEPRFGADFSNVRVHNDTRAARVARSVNARAFTLRHNVVFGAGEYTSDTFSGRKLLAHELTHVVQQSGGSTLFSTGKNSENTIPNSQELSLVSPEFTGEQSRTVSVSARSAGQDVLQRTGDLAAVLRGLEAGDWNVDTLAAQLSDEQMATLSTSDRVRLIRYIANGYSVLSSDEQTILRLFRTTPAAHRTALVGALDAALLRRLESVLHGDEYQQYHVLLRGLFFGARSVDQAVREVESARTFPWADPGLIRAIWNVRFYYEVAEFTDQGRLRFVYWTNMAFMGVRNQAVEVDPMEMILVHFHDDETEAGASRGQTIPMPAINLLSLVQKQFRGEVQVVADIALIGLGGAGLVGASTRLGRAIAALELAFGAADVVVRNFRARIARLEQGREFLAVWDIVSVFIAIYGFTRLAIEGGRIFLRLRRAWQAFRGSDDAARLGDQLDPLRQQVDDVLERADEASAAQQGGRPATSPTPEVPARAGGGRGTPPPSGLSAAATRSRDLARQIRARGDPVIANMGGAGAPHEPTGAININNQAVSRSGIPNHVQADASDIGQLFDAGSVDRVVGYHMALSVINWRGAVPGIRSVLRPGGTFRFDWRGTSEAGEVARLLREAGFREVKNISDALVTAVRP